MLSPEPINITQIVGGQPFRGVVAAKKGKKKALVKVPERPRQVIVMEERAKNRKEKRDILKKRYEDKKEQEQALKR